MDARVEEYVTVIGVTLMHPVAVLLERLKAVPPSPPNSLQASPLENAFSASVVVLMAIMLESTLNRVQYIDDPDGTACVKKPLKFLETHAELNELRDDVEELLVARDAIVHNHVWQAQITTGAELALDGAPSLRRGYGDCKAKRVVDPSARVTLRLGLNVFPTRVGRADAAAASKLVVKVLRRLEQLDRRYVYFTHLSVQYDGRMRRFVDVVDELSDC